MQSMIASCWEAKTTERLLEIEDDDFQYLPYESNRPRIGQLLVEARLIKPSQLHASIALANETQVNIGTALTVANLIDEETLEAALTAQTLIAQGILSEHRAIIALASRAQRKSFFDSVFQSGIVTGVVYPDQLGLGEILHESNLLSSAALETAKETARRARIYLGKALLLLNMVTNETLDAVLLALAMCNRQEITREAAVAALQQKRDANTSIAETLASLISAKSRPPATIGHMLVEGSIVTEFECLVALEQSLTERKKLGETLLANGLVGERSLKTALWLQRLTQFDIINTSQASVVLSKMAKDKALKFADVASELHLLEDKSPLSDSVKCLLQVSCIASEADIWNAVMEYREYEPGPLKALLLSGKISGKVYAAAFDCIAEVKNRTITFKQASEIIKRCYQMNTDFETAKQDVFALKAAREELLSAMAARDRALASVAARDGIKQSVSVIVKESFNSSKR
jgi:hypothetical protein